MSAILSFITWGIDPVIFHLGSYSMRYYTLCFLLAFISSYVIMLRIFKKEHQPQELLDQLTIYIFLGTLIGARLGHCLFYEFDYYKNHLLEMVLPIQFKNGSIQITGFQGLASHGGAIGILTALFLFCRKTKTNFLWITDRIVIVVAIAGAFVRLGNFFNSEIIGRPTDVPWAVIFTRVDMQPRHPAQLYEALAYVCIFILLYWLYNTRKNLKPGLIFGIFLILLFGARFGLEFLKENQEDFENGMQYNMGQLLSIPFMLLGVFLLFRKPPAVKK
ncbi:Prolipoprotein diacylglyceryl transferase [bacterium A37T11]|nr:Prolipoprotein diacylglyceryl transferase [bacterium A37T11]